MPLLGQFPKNHQFIFTDMSLTYVGNSFNKRGDIGRSGSLLVYIAVTDSDPTARTGNATPSGRTKRITDRALVNAFLKGL